MMNFENNNFVALNNSYHYTNFFQLYPMQEEYFLVKFKNYKKTFSLFDFYKIVNNYMTKLSIVFVHTMF